jgi:kynurenine formamidase
MAQLVVEVAGRIYLATTAEGLDIAIPLDFAGAQPAHFGAPPARSEPMRSGGFVGDTSAGGSCNARVYSLNPHCNGTHTESVSHLTDEAQPIGRLLRAPLYLAALVSVTAEAASDTKDTAAHPFAAGDRVITRKVLARALGHLRSAGNQALVVRTLPNGPDKLSRRYEGESPAPFFTREAARFLVERGVEHLLVDVPSIDRAHDGGLLAAHRIFWGLPDGSRSLALAARPEATITELVYVPDVIPDGLYLLSLQVPAFMSDAAPSRVLLYPATLEEDA